MCLDSGVIVKHWILRESDTTLIVTVYHSRFIIWSVNSTMNLPNQMTSQLVELVAIYSDSAKLSAIDACFLLNQDIIPEPTLKPKPQDSMNFNLEVWVRQTSKNNWSLMRFAEPDRWFTELKPWRLKFDKPKKIIEVWWGLPNLIGKRSSEPQANRTSSKPEGQISIFYLFLIIIFFNQFLESFKMYWVKNLTLSS